MNEADFYENLIRSNPNLKRFLDLIGWSEHADYNIGYNNRIITSFQNHPYPKCSFISSTGQPNYSGVCSKNTTSAAGKYQFVRQTWDSVKRQLGLKDFSPNSQDIAAVKLIKDRNALNDVLSGNIASAIQKLKPEWESFRKRSLPSLLQKFGNGNLNVNRPMIGNVSLVTKSSDRSRFNGNAIIGDKNRYLIAFAILVLVFIFALKR